MIMKKSLIALPLLALILLFVSGCLTCEKKEYTFTLTGNESGTLTIKYINILSSMDDSLDVSEEDFMSLVNDYYTGSSVEDQYPGTELKSKKLFEENGVLCGEIVLEFSDLSQVKLYRHKGKGSYMYPLNCGSFDSETFDSGNGEYGGENMPVVFWDQGTKTMTMTTYVTYPDETTVSLLDEYLAWKGGME
jgi:hypothetical protein